MQYHNWSKNNESWAAIIMFALSVFPSACRACAFVNGSHGHTHKNNRNDRYDVQLYFAISAYYYFAIIFIYIFSFLIYYHTHLNCNYKMCKYAFWSRSCVKGVYSVYCIEYYCFSCHFFLLLSPSILFNFFLSFSHFLPPASDSWDGVTSEFPQRGINKVLSYLILAPSILCTSL